MKKICYILIVDDDPVIREGLAAEVSKEFKDSAEILSCKNGAIAAELLKCNTIDILITDIKMPAMSGIELLTFIQARHIHCKSIVLSSYDDFNLVRYAMKLGACDYLLKPVDLSSLYQLIYKMQSQLILEQKNASGSIPLDTYGLIDAYLTQSREKSAEMLAFEERYDITKTTPCILGCIKLQTYSSQKLFALHEYFRSELYEHLNRSHVHYSVILCGEASSCFVFIIFPETDLALCANSLECFTKKLTDERFNIKISTHFHTFELLSHAFKECLSYFDLSYYDLPDSPHTYSLQSKNDCIHKLIDALSTYDLKSSLTCLDKYFDEINSQKPPVDDIKKELSHCLYELIKINPKYIEVLGKSKFTDYDIFHQIETAPSLSFLKKQLFNTLNHLVKEVLNILPNKEDCIISKAKSYIKDNYNDCITLEDIAAHVYLNKNYFSALFKNSVGLTYREYLRNYRISQAIRLLSETDMKIYEIAQVVGYSDSAHFLRAFKTVTGQKPEYYKPKH